MDTDTFWDVLEDEELLAFLRRYEAWRADGLIKCGLVTVQHKNGAREKPSDPRFKLVKGDKIIVPIGVPSGKTVRDVLLPEKCLRELEADATARARDFVFKPRQSDYEDNMLNVLRQARGRRLEQIQADDLATFLIRLKRYDDAPVGTIYIVAHGWTRGNLMAKLRPQRPAMEDYPITYENLAEAAKEITTIKVHPPLFLPPRPRDPTTRNPIPAAVRIRACRIGVHPIFLKKLKEALGPGIDVVSGPRFLQDAGTVGSRGLIEFFRNEFTVLSRRKLERAALITAFQTGDLAFAPGPPTFYDGRAVPARSWQDWIPRQLTLTDWSWVETAEIPVVIPVPNNPGRSRLRVHFGWRELPLAFRAVMTKEKPSSTNDARAKFAAYVNALGASQPWSDRHPFPMSVRLGYKNLDELVKGFEWDVTADREQYVFHFKGKRQEYSVLTPLMNGNDLLCNFYPTDPGMQILEMFRDDDPRFFTSV
jgi:hypothetical protein